MSTEDTRTQLAFQIAAQLPGNLEDALYVLSLAAKLVECAAKLAATTPEIQERVLSLRVVTGGPSSL
jgi:hypothetical protein